MNGTSNKDLVDFSAFACMTSSKAGDYLIVLLADNFGTVVSTAALRQQKHSLKSGARQHRGGW
eukprot:2968394-Amphidinium_carterae.1